MVATGASSSLTDTTLKRLNFFPGSVLRRKNCPEATFSTAQGSKRIDVADGAVEATVAPQPAGRPLILATLHAEARVRGTRLLVASEVSSTRFEVTEGAVEFVRRSDGQTILVRNGYSAVDSPNT
jgi:ferric-dicitrate binding protein FerR (iron transport regulator)